MATSNPRNILVFLFYTGLTTSFLSFLTLLDTVFHKSLDAAEGGGLSAPQLIPFVNIRGGLPIGALLLTGIVLFLLMHFEVKFLQEGRLLFDADRSQRFYVLATVCILSIIVTVGDLFEVYYEHGIASSRETHIYGLLKLFLASCGIAFALFSAASKRFLFRWNWVRETVLVLFMSVAVFLMSS